MVPHGASEQRYKNILNGSFEARPAGLDMLGYDLDNDADQAVPAAGMADGSEDDALDTEMAQPEAWEEGDADLLLGLAEKARDPSDDSDGLAEAEVVETPALEPPVEAAEVHGQGPGAAALANLPNHELEQVANDFELRRGRWGIFSIIPKPRSSRMPHGGYQARCVFHRPPYT